MFTVKNLARFVVVVFAISVPATHGANAAAGGWCQVWNDKGKLIDQEQCIATVSCDDESGEICDITYTWPSGGRTVANYVDGFFEYLNGIPADTVSVQSARCAYNPKSNNTFCFTEAAQKAETVVQPVNENNLSADGVPRISFAATWPADENSGIVSLLERSNGKTVFLEEIDFSGHPFPEFRAVEKGCSHKGPAGNEEPGALNNSTVNLPVPAEYYRDNNKHLFFNPETYEGYHCDFGVHLELKEPRVFPFTSGGTGMLSIRVNQEFRVSVLVNGAQTTFHLREVQVTGGPKQVAASQPKSRSCNLPNGNTTYQQEAEAWLELLSALDLNSPSEKRFVCPDFKKVLKSPPLCLEPKTLTAIASWDAKLACD